jgi:hypothetical protein
MARSLLITQLLIHCAPETTHFHWASALITFPQVAETPTGVGQRGATNASHDELAGLDGADIGS